MSQFHSQNSPTRLKKLTFHIDRYKTNAKSLIGIDTPMNAILSIPINIFLALHFTTLLINEDKNVEKRIDFKVF